MRIVSKNLCDNIEMLEKMISEIKPPERLELGHLKQTVIDSKNFRYALYRRSHDQVKDARNADEATLNRWIVNFIRHNSMDYDIDLKEAVFPKNNDIFLIKYRKAVLETIKSVYPELSCECDRQLEYKIRDIYENKLIWDV